MAVLEIIEVPDPRLKEKSVRVDIVDDGVRRLLDDMLETMYAAPGVGLAAPQVGVLRRLIVIDPARKNEPPAPMKLVNPEITATSEEKIMFNEGCLSVPKQYADVERFKAVTVSYLDEDGEKREIDAEDMLAVVLQHEIDHLDGIVFLSHLSRLKRQMLLKKLERRRLYGDEDDDDSECEGSEI